MTFSATTTIETLIEAAEACHLGETLVDSAIYVAPARFDVHTTNHFVGFANEAFAAGNDLVLDLRMVDFLDEHTNNTIADITAQADRLGLNCTIASMSAAAALTFDLLNRAAA